MRPAYVLFAFSLPDLVLADEQTQCSTVWGGVGGMGVAGSVLHSCKQW